MISYCRLLYLVILLLGSLFSTEIELNEVKEIISSNNEEIEMGNISNLQIAPFNENLISFEVDDAEDPTIKLFLYNIEEKTIFQIQSANYSTSKKGKKRYYLKDRGLKWHPTEKYFIFYGNGHQKRDQLFLCKVLVPELINNFSIKGYMIDIREKKGLATYYQSPCFNSTGDKVFFSRRIRKKDKKARYNRTFNLVYTENVLSYESKKFQDLEFDLVLDKKFDQLSPICSPTDPDLIAYTSYKNKRRKGEDYYHEYSVNILNLKTEKITVVEKMDGYDNYPFQWSPSGKYLFYYKALSLLMTKQSFIDDKMNLLNLKFAKITKDGDNVKAFIQSNPKTDIVLKDVTGKNNSIAFINEDNILVSKFDPMEAITLVDLQKWRDVEKKYSNKLGFSNDTDYPTLLGNNLYFISYEEVKGRLVVAANLSEIKITLSEGQSREIASSSTSESESVSKAQIEELESQISKFNDELTKIEKDVSEEQAKLDTDNKELSALTDQKESFIKSKDSVVAIRNDLRSKQSASLEGEQEISKFVTQKAEIETNISHEEGIVESENEKIEKLLAEKTSLQKEKKNLAGSIVEYERKLSEQLAASKNLTAYQDKIKIAKGKIAEIEDSMSKLNKDIETENIAKAKLEKDLAGKNTEKAKYLGAIDNLKIEKAKTLESEGMLASFEEQLKELKTKSGNLVSEIKVLETELKTEKTELSTNTEKQSSKEKSKKDLLSSVEKLKK
ncbi:MAG: hypothetical protein KAS62_04455, partial [Candidatus Delongbacteria bacterium]|nr:hypothetical protein [Candidatus Delongbacteria bacterium]